jgi:hypothetical protein
MEPHVAPLNAIVDELVRLGRPGSYVDPADGGVNARILWLAESPGPRSSAAHGSGLISVDYDDPSAARGFRLLREAGLPRALLVHWNVAPSYVSKTSKNVNATKADFPEAIPWLHRFVAALPRPRVMVLAGGVARDCWFTYAPREEAPMLPVLCCPHGSNRVRAVIPDFEGRIVAVMRKALRAATATTPNLIPTIPAQERS